MKSDILVKNYTTYRKALDRLIGDEAADKLIESVGGDEAVMNASYSNLLESGSAFGGSFVKNVIKMSKLATSLNELLPEGIAADPKSIGKVCLLSQIAKVVMLSRNDNNWEVFNRGMVYKYNTLEGALRTGERSILLAANAGVKFTPVEYEAMGILDRNPEEDNYKKYFSSPLSTVVRQAAELVGLINRNTETK